VKLKHINAFLEEFQEESDRAAAVLGAAYLDECLSQLIASFLVDDPTKVDRLLQGPLAPLGHFESRISASYCMGLISKNEHHDLQIIRGIRNEFAHELHGLSFSNARVRDKCSALQIPKKVMQLMGSRGARPAFTYATAHLSLQLQLRTLGQVQHRRVVPDEFELAEVVD